MTNLADLTTGQLQRIIAIKEQIEGLQSQIESIVAGAGGDGEFPTPSPGEAPKGQRRRFAAVRAKMAASQKARRAKIKGNGATDSEPEKKGKRRMSAAGRAAMAAGAKARWARVKGANVTTTPAKKKDKRSSPATRAKLAAAAKARWAKVKAEGKKGL